MWTGFLSWDNTKSNAVEGSYLNLQCEYLVGGEISRSTSTGTTNLLLTTGGKTNTRGAGPLYTGSFGTKEESFSVPDSVYGWS